MRVAALLALATLACGGKRDDARGDHPKRERSRAVLRTTYSLEAGAEIVDLLHASSSELRARIADERLDATVIEQPDGLAITTTDATKRTSIEHAMQDVLGDRFERRTCAPALGPDALCASPTQASRVELRNAALKSAAATVGERLATRDPDATARVEGGMIVVETSETDPDKVSELRALISRPGRLEFLVVDSGSELMQRVYRRVGSLRGGAATDPRAEALGIRAEIDHWRPEDGPQQTDYYLTASGTSGQSGRQVLDEYLRDLAQESPEFAIPPDHRIVYERVVPPRDAKDSRPYFRSYYVEAAPRLTGSAIADAKATTDPNLNRPIVLLDFNRFGARVFGDLTAQITGKKLATLLDGLVTSAPIINGPIRGGRASITMGGADPERQQREADELATVLRAGSLPAPLREETVEELR